MPADDKDKEEKDKDKPKTGDDDPEVKAKRGPDPQANVPPEQRVADHRFGEKPKREKPKDHRPEQPPDAKQGRLVRVFLDGYKYIPCWWGSPAALSMVAAGPGGAAVPSFNALPTFPDPPTLLVVHCQPMRRDIAPYLADPVDRPDQPNTVRCSDGVFRRRLAAHGAWSEADEDFIQCLSLHLQGLQTWDSRWKGRMVREMALHVELPGPPEQESRPAVEIDALRRFATACKGRAPALTHWLRHSDINPKHKDPGPGLPDDWAAGILEYAK